MKKYLLGFLLLSSSFSNYCAENGVASSQHWLKDVFTGVVSPVVALLGALIKDPYFKYPAMCFTSVYVLSLMQKENPQFFGRMERALWSPWVSLRKKCEHFYFSGGQSLSWNDIALWRNHVYNMLTPLTKQATGVDLNKERRKLSIDQEDSKEQKDILWENESNHIKQHLQAISDRLTCSLGYYQSNNVKSEKALQHNDEVLCYIEELKMYLKETIEIMTQAKSTSVIDKEHLKRHLLQMCESFEHLALLIDPAAVLTKDSNGYIKMKNQSTSAAGGGYGGYYGGGYVNDSAYSGMSGSSY